MFFKVLVFSLVVFAAEDQVCEKDSDCVPESSCHPTRAVNKKFVKDTGGMMCTMDCRTILDCGRGVITCENGQCTVKEKGKKDENK